MNRPDRLEALSEAVIPEAIEWVQELRAYRIYQGKDAEYFKKARIGIGVVGGAIRLCATAENARTNDLIEARQHLLPPADGQQGQAVHPSVGSLPLEGSSNGSGH